MNRIEKIKERLKANEGQFHKDKIALDDDVRYLLTRLEIADEELQRKEHKRTNITVVVSKPLEYWDLG